MIPDATLPRRHVACNRCEGWGPYHPVVVVTARNGRPLFVRFACHAPSLWEPWDLLAMPTRQMILDQLAEAAAA